ncbi:MAG: tRNA preQ1(34) S-adenosylmethionine ribosyltransferase-isomerase QueA [Chloroflexi bacterium]|nr:tRNA preQ1(34) S-adenosylmethionine ribosyltransferase-isomerase QueA [Chloroflexota bacterium]
MRTSDFDYHLPPELIAQSPIEPRDSSRLLVLHRDTGALEHRRFAGILEYLRPGDVMVFNQSRVIPARLYGRRADTGSKVEFLLLRRDAAGTWQALAKPARRLRAGVVVDIEEKSPQPPFTKGGLNALGNEGEQDRSGSTSDREEEYLSPFRKGGTEGGFRVEIVASHQDGLKTVRLSSEEAIERFGHTPLPPYIRNKLDDPERYQTVYSRHPGSVAAPTAGLHFTGDLLQKIRDLGVETVFVTLHVGLDTFRPVDEDDPADHKIHTEHYQIDRQAADALNRARADGRRIIAVGTTSVRVLEQAALDMEQRGETALSPTESEAGLYILPGHRFRLVDAMVTNFHLPRSSLLMLVSAFVENGQGRRGPSTCPISSPDASGSTSGRSSGRAVVLAAYREAIDNGYRFYSFGDAMFLV